MKLARKVGLAMRWATGLSMGVVPYVAPLALASMVVSCADENDPQTWVKRLDDPAQRPQAIKRLSQFFEDGLTKANKDREAPAVKGLLDKIVEPLTKQYTTGGLDDKTRKELLKVLADTRDERTGPALAKAFNEYEPGKNDEELKYAAQCVTSLVKAGKSVDEKVAEAVWNGFAKFQVSKTKSINLVKDLHDAVLAVKHPTYGPRAVEKLSAPVDPKNPEQVRDHLEFWQKTSAQILGETKFTPGVRTLVTTLLTPSKESLRSTVTMALLKMPKEAETQLVAALNGSDPEYAKLTAAYGPEKMYVAIVADSLAWISRPGGRDAILAALPGVDNDTNRVVLAQSLYRFPADPRILPAFLESYKKVPPGTLIPMLHDYGRANYALVASHFYDPNLLEWLLKECASISGDEAEAFHNNALESAIKLMPQGKTDGVRDATKKFGTGREEDMFNRANIVVGKCTNNVACYMKTVTEPVASSPNTASTGPVKAAYMIGIFGNAGHAKELAGQLDRIKDPRVRLAAAETVDRLLPTGDRAVADTLDKVVEADRSTGNAALLEADDALVKVALRLRARSL